MSAETVTPRAPGFIKQVPWWAVLLGCAVILVARSPGAFFHPQMWAEEGIFYHQAYTMGAEAIFKELADYLHLVPRLTAALATSLDPAYVPTVFMAVPFVLTLWVVSRTLCVRCPLPLPALCALAVVLVPDAGEVLLTTVNIQWVLAVGFILILVSEDPRNGFEYGHDIVALVLCGLTGPFSIVLAPLFAWRAITRRTTGSVVLAVVVAACALTQFIVIWHHPAGIPPNAKVEADAVVAVTGIRLAGSLFGGALLPKSLPLVASVVLTILSIAGTALLTAWPGGARKARVWLGIICALMLAAAIYRYRFMLPMLCTPGNGSRYFFAPQVIVLWLLIAAIGYGKVFARLAIVLLVWSVAVNVPRYRSDTLPDQHWEKTAPKIRAGEEVTFTINPGWNFTLPARSELKKK